MRPTDHEHYSEVGRQECYQCSLEDQAEELAGLRDFIDDLMGEPERPLVDRLRQFVAQAGSNALSRIGEVTELRDSLRVLAGFARFFVEASDVRGGDIHVFAQARDDLKRAVETFLDGDNLITNQSEGFGYRMRYQAGLIDGQKRMEHFMHVCTDLNKVLAEGTDISADDLVGRVTALKDARDNALYTRDVFAALAAEYRHALEHVATCGGTCHDCQRLSKSALGHENHKDFLDQVMAVDGLKDHFLPMLKMLVAELEHDL